MKRFFLSLLAILFPWLILLMNDNPGGALVALLMQATVIGWIPATMWAWRVVHGTTQEDKLKAQAKAKAKKKSKT